MSRRHRVLVVDDDDLIHGAYDAFLAREPLDVVHARSSAEGLAQLAAQAIDLVLCDVMMPEEDGYAFCTRVRHSDGPWRVVPVVLVTALSGIDDLVRGIDAGADEFLTKPVQGDALRARIRGLLRMRARLHTDPPSATSLEDALRARVDRVAAELSPREREVLDLLLLGRSHDEIGAALRIAPRTAKFHQANVLRKLGADSRADLLRVLL